MFGVLLLIPAVVCANDFVFVDRVSTMYKVDKYVNVKIVDGYESELESLLHQYKLNITVPGLIEKSVVVGDELRVPIWNEYAILNLYRLHPRYMRDEQKIHTFLSGPTYLAITADERYYAEDVDNCDGTVCLFDGLLKSIEHIPHCQIGLYRAYIPWIHAYCRKYTIINEPPPILYVLHDIVHVYSEKAYDFKRFCHENDSMTIRIPSRTLITIHVPGGCKLWSREIIYHPGLSVQNKVGIVTAYASYISFVVAGMGLLSMFTMCLVGWMYRKKEKTKIVKRRGSTWLDKKKGMSYKKYEINYDSQSI